MERIVIFNDFANTNSAFRQQGIEPDYMDLLDYLSEGRFLIEAHTYVPIDPRNPHARDRLIERLWESGHMVHTKVGAIAGDTYKCDFDVELTLGLMSVAEVVKPDIIALVSGDKDFVPVILKLRERGIRVEVAAFRGVNAAREVTLKANGFIDLGEYVRIRRDGDPTDIAPSESYPNDEAIHAAPAAPAAPAEEDTSPILSTTSFGRTRIQGDSPPPPTNHR